MIRSSSPGASFNSFASSLGYKLRSSVRQLLRTETAGQQDVLVDLSHSSGAALVMHNKVQRLGLTPMEDDIRGVVKWLQASHINSILYTTQLSRYYSPALDLADKCTGMLALCIAYARCEYLLFFKPPIECERLGEETSGGGLQMTVNGPISQPWTKEEINKAMVLREDFLRAGRSGMKLNIKNDIL